MKVNEGTELPAQPSESPRPALVNRIYVGRLPCGCAVAASIDPEDVAEMARDGYEIETVNRETVEVPGCQCRFFTNQKRFGDGTAYLRSKAGGMALVATDGTEKDAGNWTLAECLTMVKKNHWREITADEAKRLITTHQRG